MKLKDKQHPRNLSSFPQLFGRVKPFIFIYFIAQIKFSVSASFISKLFFSPLNLYTCKNERFALCAKYILHFGAYKKRIEERCKNAKLA